MAESRGAVYALWPLRIVLAAVFLSYGVDKWQDIGGTADMFASWGIPAASIAAPMVAVAETLGALALFAGVLSRFSAAVLSLVMVTAIVVVKLDAGFQGVWDFDLALLGGLVTILINGPGRPTLTSIVAEVKDARAARNATV